MSSMMVCLRYGVSQICRVFVVVKLMNLLLVECQASVLGGTLGGTLGGSLFILIFAPRQLPFP